MIDERFVMIGRFEDEFRICDKANANNLLNMDETIDYLNGLNNEKEYWKNKAMILLSQVRRLTSRMTDAEVKEFSKELEDE